MVSQAASAETSAGTRLHVTLVRGGPGDSDESLVLLGGPWWCLVVPVLSGALPAAVAGGSSAAIQNTSADRCLSLQLAALFSCNWCRALQSARTVTGSSRRKQPALSRTSPAGPEGTR
jgi:hypothetical protein